jgi:putative NIF3 family GTP cyclohydrolase 1 type 2
MSGRVTRRRLGALLAAAPLSAYQPLTAAQVVERIQNQLARESVSWRPSFFDGFHIGDPTIALTGIATCFQPTFRVLQQAAAANRNFVIAHESSFWDGFDPVAVMRNDPVFQAKVRFADRHKMAVWRIHDHWHRRRPDPIFRGLARKLDWLAYYNDDIRPGYYAIPDAPLEEVARHIQRRLGTDNVVVVGDPKMRVRTVGDCAHVLASVLPSLRNCDVALVGETPQHDTFEYVRDAISLGMNKAVIMISHQALEEWGMEDFAPWLRPLVPEVPVEWIGSGEPFQVPRIRT